MTRQPEATAQHGTDPRVIFDGKDADAHLASRDSDAASICDAFISGYVLPTGTSRELWRRGISVAVRAPRRPIAA